MLTLREYVLKRNGVPLGARGSLVRSFRHSFGADSNAGFWKYWNPVWGFYLAKFVYLPLKKQVHWSVATLAAFAVSGALHDLAIGLAGKNMQGFFTTWFLVMGLFLVVSKRARIQYGSFGFTTRVFINASSIAFCFFLARQVKNLAL